MPKRTATKRKPGRPKAITPKVQERLLSAIASGKTLHEACRTVGIHYDTLAAHRLRDDAFSVASARATLLGVEANMSLCETRLKRSTNKRISVDRELAHHFRWKASKLLSAYKDRLGVELEGQVSMQHGWADPADPMHDIELARRLCWTLALGEKYLREHGFEQLSRLWRLEEALAAHGIVTPAPKGWEGAWPPPRPAPRALYAPLALPAIEGSSNDTGSSERESGEA